MMNPTKVQARLRNLMSNFQTGHSPSLRGDVPIWLLGRCYAPETPSLVDKITYVSDSKDGKEVIPPHMEAFQWDFRSRLWFTYRSNFPKLGPNLTTDAGWGCMLRTGQMIVAQALLTMALGRDWRLCPGPSALPPEYGEVLRWFADSHTPNAPYSIHHIAHTGVGFGKRIGDWFEPTTMCKVIQHLMDEHQPHLGPLRRRVRVYVTDDDRTVYAEEIANLCVPTDSAVIILIPLMLGLDTINPEYLKQIAPMFAWPQFLGIAGGRPRSSMYFIGLQSCVEGFGLSAPHPDADHTEDLVTYLDPHLQRPSFPMEGSFNSSSFHCRNTAAMPLSSLDPSMAIGFLCSSNAEWLDLIARVHSLDGLSNIPPVFCVAQSRPQKNISLRSSQYASSSSSPPSVSILESSSSSSQNTKAPSSSSSLARLTTLTNPDLLSPATKIHNSGGHSKNSLSNGSDIDIDYAEDGCLLVTDDEEEEDIAKEGEYIPSPSTTTTTTTTNMTKAPNNLAWKPEPIQPASSSSSSFSSSVPQIQDEVISTITQNNIDYLSIGNIDNDVEHSPVPHPPVRIVLPEVEIDSEKSKIEQSGSGRSSAIPTPSEDTGSLIGDFSFVSLGDDGDTDGRSELDDEEPGMVMVEHDDVTVT